MKKLFIIAATFLLSISALAQDGKSIYNKFSDEPGVSAVYISPAMFKLIGKIPELELGANGEKVDITPVVKSLKGFYLLHCSDNSISSRISSDIKKLIGSEKMELIMEAKDDGETVRFFTNGDENVIQSLLMTVIGNGETTFISMDGLISRNDFEKLMKAAQE